MHSEGRDGVSTRKNTAFNMAYRVFSILLPLVTAPFLSRKVFPEGMGLYSEVWNVSYFMCLLAMLGLENYGTRAVAAVRDERERLNRTFSAIWRMQRGVACVALALWLGYVFIVPGEKHAVALSLTLMSVSCLFNLDWALMGLDQFKPIALRNTAVKLLAAACVFLFIREKKDLWIYGFAWSAATAAGCVLSAASLRGKVSPVRVSQAEALEHLKPCAMLFVSVLAVSVYRIMDKVMVSNIAGLAENGLYENAEKIIYCLSGFISAVGTVMLPKSANLHRKGETERVLKHMDVTMQGILCMTSAMAFGVAAVADRLCPLFFGEAFTGSARLMAPLGFSLIFIGFANVVRTQWILPRERDRIVIRSVCAGAAVNLFCNSLLIPAIGAMGAVLGTLAAEFMVPLMQWGYLSDELPYRTFLKYAGLYALLGAVMLAAVRLLALLLPPTWAGMILQIVLGAALYAVLCLMVWRKAHSPLLRLIPFARHNRQ